MRGTGDMWTCADSFPYLGFAALERITYVHIFQLYVRFTMMNLNYIFLLKTK
jgi:hypothetical protein